MENIDLIDSVDLISIDMEKAKVLLEEIQSEYLTGIPIMEHDEARKESFMQGLFLEFNRYSTLVDILGDYMEDIEGGLGALREMIQEGTEQ